MVNNTSVVFYLNGNGLHEGLHYPSISCHVKPTHPSTKSWADWDFWMPLEIILYRWLWICCIRIWMYLYCNWTALVLEATFRMILRRVSEIDRIVSARGRYSAICIPTFRWGKWNHSTEFLTLKKVIRKILSLIILAFSQEKQFCWS